MLNLTMVFHCIIVLYAVHSFMRNISKLIEKAASQLRLRQRSGINGHKPKNSSSPHLALMADLEKMKSEDTSEEDAPIKKYMLDAHTKRVNQSSRGEKEDETSKESSSCLTTVIAVVVVAILGALIFYFSLNSSPSIPNDVDVQQNLKGLVQDFPR
jgi:hypothetical protein